MAIFVLFWYFFSIFSVFSGANPGWGISYFFRILGVLGFLGSVAGPQGHKYILAKPLLKRNLFLVPE